MQALSPFAVASGPLLGLLLVPNFYLAYLPLFLKLLTIGVVLTGLILGLTCSPGGRNLLAWGLATLWLLPLVSTSPLAWPTLGFAHVSRL